MGRFIRSALVLGMLAGLASRAAAADDPIDIVKKAITAMGGADKIEKFKGSKTTTKGTLSLLGMDIEITSESVSMYPDKQKNTMSMQVMGNTFTVVQTIVGDKISMKLNGADQEIPDAQKSELKQSTALTRLMNLTPLLSDKSYKLKALGDSKVDGKDVVGIEVSSDKLKATKLFFDKTTHLIAKVERMGLDPTGGAEVKQEMVYSDHKKTQGIMRPSKTTVLSDGKKMLESTTTKLELMEKVDDKEFGE